MVWLAGNVLGILLAAGAARRWQDTRGTVALVLLGLCSLEAAATVALMVLYPPVDRDPFDDPPMDRTEARLPAPLDGLPGGFSPARTTGIPRPDDAPLRVVFVGDSFTYGDGVAEGDTLPSQFEAAAEAAWGRDVEVINHGLSGWGFVDQVSQITQHTWWWQADLIVWVYLPNDFGDPPTIRGDAGLDLVNDFETEIRDVRRTSIETLVAHVRRRMELHQRTLDWYAHRLDAHDRSGQARKMLEVGQALVTDGAEVLGTDVVVATYPLLFALDAYPFADHHRAVLDGAEAAGARAVDLLPAFAGQRASDLWVSRQNQHPNAAGHRLAAEHLVDALGDWPSTHDPTRSPCPELPATWTLGTSTSWQRLCEDPTDVTAWRDTSAWYTSELSREATSTRPSQSTLGERYRLASMSLLMALELAPDDPDNGPATAALVDAAGRADLLAEPP